MLGYFFHMSEAEVGHKLDEAAIERQHRGNRALEVPAGHVHRTERRRGAVPQGLRAAGQSRLFTAAAPSSGFFSVRQRSRRRRALDAADDPGGEDLFPPLAILLVLALPRQAAAGGAGRAAAASRASSIGERFDPDRRGGQMLINYRGRRRPFRTTRSATSSAASCPPARSRTRSCWSGRRRSASTTSAARRSHRVPGSRDPRDGHRQPPDRDFIARPRWSRIFDLLAIVVLPLLVRARAAAPVRLRRTWSSSWRSSWRFVRRRLSAVRRRAACG